MNAFVAMLATVHADQNTGADAAYTRASGGAAISLRVVLSSPTDQITGFGSAGVRAGSVTADVLASDLSGIAPRRGDTLVVNATTYRVDDVQRDPLGLSYRLTLAT